MREETAKIVIGGIDICDGCKNTSKERCVKCNEEINNAMSQHPESCSCHDCCPELYDDV